MTGHIAFWCLCIFLFFFVFVLASLIYLHIHAEELGGTFIQASQLRKKGEFMDAAE